MAHLTLDYSPNLEGEVDFAALCDHLRRAMIETGVFPLAGIRVRAIPAAYASIADGSPEHGYLDMAIRLRGGRNIESKKAATAHVFAAAEAFLTPLMARRPLALSLEMRDIDPELSPKTGTIRDHLKDQD